MEGWNLIATIVGAAAFVIAIPMFFVLRALSKLSERTAALATVLQEVQETAASVAELNELSTTLERPGGA